jgi:hypothetical protein
MTREGQNLQSVQVAEQLPGAQAAAGRLAAGAAAHHSRGRGASGRGIRWAASLGLCTRELCIASEQPHRSASLLFVSVRRLA